MSLLRQPLTNSTKGNKMIHEDELITAITEIHNMSATQFLAWVEETEEDK